ncbi:UNVERIFIED_CONTAM: hypothetical protein HDU68_005694 [Siphonaria sp. JEL0065]|nr:hypothetical protein HDU68_005694 [Siphonaria sp. JEL0065]
MLSNEVWRKYRKHWEDQSQLGPEPKFTCVQCNQEFVETQNGDGACRYHIQLESYCCSPGAEGCQRNRHSSKHHNNFDYANFYTWRSAIFEYSSYTSTFAVLSADDFAANNEEVAYISIGAILDTYPPECDKLFVNVAWGNSFWFQTYSSSQLSSIASSVSRDSESLLLSKTGPNGETVSVTWLLENSEIIGLRAECSSKTSLSPSVVKLLFCWPNSAVARKNGPMLTFRNFSIAPQFGELPLLGAPDSAVDASNPYSLPTQKSFKGERIQEYLPRESDKNLAKWALPKSTPLRFNLLDSTVLHDINTRTDWFNMNISVLNSSPSPSTITDVRVYARLRVPDDESFVLKFPEVEGADEDDGITLTGEWKEITQVRAGVQKDSSKLPAQIVGLGSTELAISAVIGADRYYSSKDKMGGWRKMFSWISYSSGLPVVLDIELEDIHGNIFGGMIEYPIPKLRLPTPNADATFVYTVDDSSSCDRDQVQLTVTPQSPLVIPESTIQTPTNSKGDDEADRTVSKHPLWNRDNSFSIKLNEQNSTHYIKTTVLRYFVLLAESSKVDPFSRFGVLDISKFIFYSYPYTAGFHDAQFHRYGTAIIDFARRVVVGFRFKSESKTGATVVYFPVPEYGDAVSGSTQDSGVAAVPFDLPSEWVQEESGMGNLDQEAAKVEQKLYPIPDRVRVSKVAGGDGYDSGSGGATVDIQALVKALRPVIAEELRPIICEELRPIIEGELRDTIRAEVEASVKTAIRAEVEASVKAAFQDTMLGLLAEMKRMDAERDIIVVDDETSHSDTPEEYKRSKKTRSLSISGVLARFKWK